MATKFFREIVVSSLATALATAVYTHGPALKAVLAPGAAAPATLTEASLKAEDERPEDLAEFMERIASGHVGKASPRSSVEEEPAAAKASNEADPVWPPQPGAAKAAQAAATAKLAAAKPVAAPSPATAAIASTREEPPAQAEAAQASYTERLVDRLKDYVWNPGASVVSGVSSGFSAVTSKITSFVKKQSS